VGKPPLDCLSDLNATDLTRMKSLVGGLEYLCGGKRPLELAFGDERWAYRQGFNPDWSADRWFLQFLSRGPWSSTEAILLGLERKYSSVKRPIGKMTGAQVRAVASGIGRKGHNFQRTVQGYLLHLNDYLADRQVGIRGFENTIRALGWKRGRAEIRRACGVGEGRDAKVLDCWIRDRLRLFSFPVDSVVRRVVKDPAYGLPDEPDQLVELARAVRRNPRFIARATWYLGEDLID
jgi:hypothetical protein